MYTENVYARTWMIHTYNLNRSFWFPLTYLCARAHIEMCDKHTLTHTRTHCTIKIGVFVPIGPNIIDIYTLLCQAQTHAKQNVIATFN